MVQKNRPEGAWTSVEIAGHRTSVFEPFEPHPHGFTVIYLHAVGCEDLAEDPVFTSEFNRFGLRVLAPHAGESWWCDRIFPEFDAQKTAEQYVVGDIVSAAADRWGVQSPRLALLGVSMGGQGALRLAYKYPDQFPVTAAISPAIDYHLWLERPTHQREISEAIGKLYQDAEDARQDSATLHIHPLNWPRHQFFCCDPADHWHDSAERLQMKLYSLGIPHEFDLSTEAGAHSWGYFRSMAPRAIEFIVERLEKERLRVC